MAGLTKVFNRSIRIQQKLLPILFVICLLTLFIQVSKNSQQTRTSRVSSAKTIAGLTDLLNEVDCDNPKSHRSEEYNTKAKEFLSEDSIIQRTKSCENYFQTISTIAFDLATPEEHDFPLAFAYTVHKQIGIFEMFMALYFRPNDSHCVHIDQKANDQVFEAVHSIVNCYKEKFPDTHVFIARSTIPVFWGYGGSILEADQICYREIMEKTTNFKLVGNVAGTELPFVSIQKFRQRLKEAGGNVLAIQKNINPSRQRTYYETHRSGPGRGDLKMIHMKGIDPGPPPCDIHVFKGIKNGAFTPRFLDLIYNNPFGLSVYNWIFNTGHACEHFTSTMATLRVEAAGKNWKVFQRFDTGVLEQNDDQIFVNKADPNVCYKEYLYKPSDKSCKLVDQRCRSFDLDALDGGVNQEKFYWSNSQCYRATLWYVKCAGKTVRGICNYAVEDLEAAKAKKCLIGNKFDLKISPAAVMCQVKDVRNLHAKFDPGIQQNGV